MINTVEMQDGEGTSKEGDFVIMLNKSKKKTVSVV